MKIIHFYAAWTFLLQHTVISYPPVFLQYIELSIIKWPEEKSEHKEAEENSGTWVKIATFSQQNSNNISYPNKDYCKMCLTAN